jgi:excisionase family DNA binding protein
MGRRIQGEGSVYHRDSAIELSHTPEERAHPQTLILTIPQVASSLGVSRAHVYKLIKNGLPVIHLGRSLRIHIDSLQRWLQEQEVYL